MCSCNVINHCFLMRCKVTTIWLIWQYLKIAIFISCGKHKGQSNAKNDIFRYFYYEIHQRNIPTCSLFIYVYLQF